MVMDPEADPSQTWDAALDEALQSEPFWSPWANSIKDFAQKVTSAQIQEMNEFVSMCAVTPPGMASSWGHIGGSFFHKAASMVFPGGMLLPRVRCACIVAAKLCPTIKVIDSKCTLLNVGHLAKLTSKPMIPQLKQAEQCMDDARDPAKLDGYKCDMPTLKRAQCMMDSTIIWFMCGTMKLVQVPEFSTLDEIWKHFQISIGIDAKDDVEDGGAKEDAKANTDAIIRPPTTNIESLKSHAVILQQNGWLIGAHAVPRKNTPLGNQFGGVVFCVEQYEAEEISFQATGVHSGHTEKCPTKDCTALWKLVEKSTQELVVFSNAAQNKAFLIDCVRGQVLTILQALYWEYDNHLLHDRLRLYEPPTEVLSARNWAKGALKLVPLTRTIIVHHDVPKESTTSIQLGQLIGEPMGCKVWFNLAGSNNTKGDDESKKLFVPFWSIPRTGDDATTCMKMISVNKDIYVGKTVKKISIPVHICVVDGMYMRSLC